MRASLSRNSSTPSQALSWQAFTLISSQVYASSDRGPCRLESLWLSPLLATTRQLASLFTLKAFSLAHSSPIPSMHAIERL